MLPHHDAIQMPSVFCPKCVAPTSLIWAYSQSRTRTPLCKSCFYALKKTGSKRISDYQVFFLPTLFNPEPGQWKISTEKQFEFRDLTLFIEHCLDPNNVDSEKNNFITKDRTILLALVISLYDLIPALNCLSLEEFRQTYEPKLPHNTPKQRRQLLVERWQAQSKSEYAAYRKRFMRSHHPREYRTFELRHRIADRLLSEVQNSLGEYIT